MPYAILIAGALLGSAAIPAGAADVEAGRAAAAEHCTRCHVVGDVNPFGGISSTPSFQVLVERRPDYRERFETFYARRPHPHFLTVTEIGSQTGEVPLNTAPVEITLRDVENIAAYVETLKGMSQTGAQ